MSIENLNFKEKLSIFKAYDSAVSAKPEVKGELNGRYLTPVSVGSVLAMALKFDKVAPSLEKRTVSAGDECDMDLNLTSRSVAVENNDFSHPGGSKSSWVTWDTITEEVDKLERELKEDAEKAEIDLKHYSKEAGSSQCSDYKEDLSVTATVDAMKMPLTHGYYALAFDLDLDDAEDAITDDEFTMEDEVAVFDARARAQNAIKDFDLFIDSVEDVDFLEQMENETASERTVSEVPVKEAVSKHLTVSKTKGNESFKGHVERMKAFFEAASAA
ncbi:hypothetical protein [Kistimonas asteriae]|uniref:hypothetical protein n=1 Tax=Kistimonas asteriae TaxID=517724 RepID=UPI001BAA2301|nr:hypothetical protein [Kistimonas asteriae]